MTATNLAFLAQKLGHKVELETTTTKTGYERKYIRRIDEKTYTKSSIDQSTALRILNQIVWGGN